MLLSNSVNTGAGNTATTTIEYSYDGINWSTLYTTNLVSSGSSANTEKEVTLLLNKGMYYRSRCHMSSSTTGMGATVSCKSINIVL